MADNEKKSLWDSLVESLGVQPAPEAFERHQPPSTELPKVKVPEEQVQPTRKAPASDWNALATNLGLPPSEPEAPPSPARKKAADAGKRKEKPRKASEKSSGKKPSPERTEEIARSEQPFETVPDIPEDSEAQEEFESVVDEALDEVDHPTTPERQTRTEDLASQPTIERSDDSETRILEDEAGEISGMSAEKARSAFDALFSPESSTWGSAMREPSPTENPFGFEVKPRSLSEEELQQEEEIFELDATEIDIEEAPPLEKRKKPRRGRRGGRGRNKPRQREESREDESIEEEDKLQEENSDDVDDDEDDSSDLEDSQTESQPRGGGRGRPVHRNIPPWSEAIGIIVQSNLDQRGSQSKSSSSKGRGGRGGKRRKK